MEMQTRSAQKTINLYRHFVFNPVDYVQRMIIDPYNKATNKNIEITEQQLNGLEAVRQIVTAKIKKSDKRKMTEKESENAKKIGVSIMSGKGLGKDAWASWLIIWFLDCFPYPKVPCTSVSQQQLSVVLWSELSKWLLHAHCKDNFTLQNEKLYRKDLPKDVVGKRWFAFAKTANPKSSIEEQVETLAGIHEDYLMIIADESAGIPNPVFDPLEGTLTGFCNFMVQIFNPTRTKGYAIDSHNRDKEYWITLRWDARESPLSDKANIERIRNKYGEDSNPWRIRVLGLPPKADENTLIPWDLIEDAVHREQEPSGNEFTVQGVDCGGGGNKSIIATRKGHKLFPLKRNNSPDPTVLCNWISNIMDFEKPDVTRIDTIGLGWAVVVPLKEKKWATVESADSRKTADNPERFTNKRAEMFFNLREAFFNNLPDIPNDSNLIEQLGALKSATDSKGRLKIVSKITLKDTLGIEMDEVDAYAITYYRKDDFVSKGQYINKEPLRSPYETLSDGDYEWMRI